MARYYYGPGFHEGGPTLELMVNKEEYDALPKELQLIVKVACATENDLMEAEYYANNIRSFQVLKEKHAVDVREFPKEVMRAFYKTSEQVVEETSHDGEINKKIYDSYRKFRKYSMNMSNVSELGFMNGRALI